MVQYSKTNQCNTPQKQINKKKIISIIVEKALGKNSVRKKALRKIRIKEDFLNIIKDYLQKPTANITPNGEGLSDSSLK